jgi:DnaJ-class molecular chaperone
MRRQRANAARMAQRLPQLPAVLPGDCVSCGGLGVRGEGRERCPACNGSGER